MMGVIVGNLNAKRNTVYAINYNKNVLINANVLNVIILKMNLLMITKKI